MPLLDRLTLDRSKDHAPFGRQIADQLRREIVRAREATGPVDPDEMDPDEMEPRPGEPLPSENVMAAALGCSRVPIRAALDVLDQEGLIVRRAGFPTRVAPQAQQRVMDSRRYLRQLNPLRAGKTLPNQSAFTLDHGAEWDDLTISPCEFTEGRATKVEAQCLGVRVGTKVLRRFMVKRLHDQPLEIVRSVILWKTAEGTDLADPSKQPVPGGIVAELFWAGQDPTLARIKAEGRAPTADERTLLQMQTADWVYKIERVFTVDGVPVEVSWTIAPQAQNVLYFEVDLSPR